MQLRRTLKAAPAALLVLFGLTPIFAQASDGDFAITYTSGVSVGNDTILAFSNTGSSWGQTVPTSMVPANGNICVNIYAFSFDEQLQACCTCFLSPNAIGNLSVANDIVANTLTLMPVNALVIKIVSTVGVGTFAKPGCDATFGVANGAFQMPQLVGGQVGWARATGQGNTQVAFTSASLSQSELIHNANFCAFNEINGSGKGVCGIVTTNIEGASVGVCREGPKQVVTF